MCSLCSYPAVGGIDCDTIPIYGKIKITIDIDLTFICRNKNACIIKPGIHILSIDRNPPCTAVSAENADISIHRNRGCFSSRMTVFTPTVCFLNSDAITPVAAVHRKIDVPVQRYLAALILARIIPDGVCQCISAFIPRSNYIDFPCRYSDALSITGINPHRCRR